MKHKKLLLLFSIFFVLLCSLTAISASDLNDTDVIASDVAADEIVSSDVDIENDLKTEPDGGEIYDGNTFTSLNNTIGNAENVVLGHDYEYNESADADFFGGIVIDRDNVTIDGDNHYINGTGKNTVFYIINANNVTLKNIRFYNATMNVSDNYVNGGALCIENSSNINIINCNFLHCYAKTDGGAIYVKSTDPIRVTDSIFKENSAGYGGAITVHDGARLILENTTFEDNQAKNIGGALNGAHSTQIINNCTFKDNHIEMGNLVSMGGAIYEQKIDGDNEIVINNTEFKNNTVYYGDGGAIYINMQSKVLIENSKFSENNASEGGAIVCNSEKVTITIRNTEFNENEAGYCGAVKAGSSTMIEDCNFTGNNAGGGGAIGVDGVSSEKSNATVRNCNFLNNSASYGGAIYIYDKVTILNCNFTSNNASIGGGAITCYAGSDRKATINNSNFIANSAESGGAVFTVLSSIEIENSNFTENSAENGGAVSTLSNQKTSINNVEFSKNTATGYGGAILINGSIDYYPSSGTTVVNNTVFTKNAAVPGTEDIGLAEYTLVTLINVTPSDLNPKFVVEMEVSEVSDVNYTQEFTITAYGIKRFGQPLNSGGVEFYFNGYNVTMPVENGQASLTFMVLDAGSYKVNLTYVGGAENSNPTKTVEFNVFKLPAVLEVINVTNCTYGDSIRIVANVTRNGFPINEGRIFIIVNGREYSADVIDGNATIDAPNIDAGTYSVNLTYDGNYLTNNASVEFEVSRCSATIEVVSIANCTYGGSIQIKVNVTGGSSVINEGNVSAVIVNGKVYSAEVINGNATIVIPDLGLGKYDANITFGGNYLADNATAKFEVSRCPATIEVVSIANCTYGGSIQIKVNVTGGSSVINEGNVSAVIVNGKVYSAEVINGNATIVIPDLSIGKYEADITFGGNYIAENATAKFEVSLLTAVISAKDIAYVINYGGKYSAVLKNINGKAVVGEKVTFTLNGKSIGSAVTDKNGVASIQLTPVILKTAKAGKKNLVIKLVSSYYNPVSKTVKVTINKEKTKILKAKKTYKFKKSKKAKNIKVTLKNSKNKVMKNIKVTIKLTGKKIKGKKTVTAKTNKKGVVTFKLGKKLTKKTTVKYTITFKGNAYYNKVVKKGKIIVK